ncbi:hypothetical protein GCM10022381_04980 [Leifsonia kafniensis]|uniref:Uncharacterized protein n=1 Tax=Leifsonia kafniensis TaxID=475957 RepID=A0ABP7K2Z7_9MICO
MPEIKGDTAVEGRWREGEQSNRGRGRSFWGIRKPTVFGQTKRADPRIGPCGELKYRCDYVRVSEGTVAEGTVAEGAISEGRCRRSRRN